MPRIITLVCWIVGIAILGVATFVVWGRQIRLILDDEVFKSLFQFMLVVVVGGAITLLFKEYSAEQNRTVERRQLLRQMHTELLTAFNTAKRCRRKLRAHVGYSRNRDISQAPVHSDEYDRQLDSLIESQLTFEVYAKRASSDNLWFSDCKNFASMLWQVQEYLNDIIDEYEEKRRLLSVDPPHMVVSEFQKLSEFIGPSYADQPFVAEFSEPFHRALAALENTKVM